MQTQRALYIFGWMAAALLFSGCQTAQFYAQAVGGQFEVFQKQKPIHKVMTASDTTSELRHKLAQVLALRNFAETNLHLPANGHYLRYADLQRPYVVWNVHAAPEFSLEPKSWWYPFVGAAHYRGYFAEKDAQACGEKLRQKGFDVYVEGVPAYSTLGWFKDPLLNTFIHHSDTSLAETIFHELAHQRVFVSGDTDFNEAFATTVGEEGVRRWLQSTGNLATIEKYKAALVRQNDFVALVQRTRAQLKAVYENPTTALGQKRTQKAKAIDEMRAEYAQLKSRWGGDAGYDQWFKMPMNNAQLNTISTYYHLVPAFTALLETSGGNLSEFYQEVEWISQCPKTQRHRHLAAPNY